MNLWSLTKEIPVEDTLGQCTVCDEVFPFVNVLSCRRLKGGDVPICLTCHQRFHPACTIAQSVLSSSHYQCHVCAAKRGVLVCALCSVHDSTDEILEGVLMCEDCSDQIHSTPKQHHSDHFYPVASPDVVSIKGPIHWHNLVDFRYREVPANHSLPRAALHQQYITNHQSTNQLRRENERGGAPGPKPPLAGSGGSGSGSQVHVKTKGNSGAWDRFSRGM